MSPGELRRLAGRKLAESRTIAADADRLRSEAAGLSGLLEPLLAMSAGVWVGPAAAEFEASLGQHGRTLAEQSTLLLRFAGEMDDRVSRRRAEADSLRDRAAAAEAAEGASLISTPGAVV